MSVKPSPSKVLVTAANSFIAAAIMDRLVDRGVKINATVRSEKDVQPLVHRYKSSIAIFLVPNITEQQAFFEAVRGCDAIFHLASPFRREFKDAKTDMLDPAIKSALSALYAANHEPKVRRVILTSSVAACLNPMHPDGFQRPGYTYSEMDWNPLSYEQASSFSAFPPVFTASRALAERAAWDYVRSASRHFDLVAINPCLTWGKYSQHVESAAAMNFTNTDLSKLMDGERGDVPPTSFPWVTDIDEVAQAHVNALYNAKANGRYIVANSPYDFQQVVDLMHKEFADSDWIKNVPLGAPGEYRAASEMFALDNSRSRRELGVVYRPWQQSVVDFCTQYGEDRKRFFS